MSNISRREALALFTSGPLAAAICWLPTESEAAYESAQAARGETARRQTPFEPKFFTAHEYAMVVALADWIIPKDERSGSASEAGVPQFMDFTMVDQPQRQTAMRGGLAWIDYWCETRFDKDFLNCSEVQQRQLLDAIAFPARVEPELAHGAVFFSSFRDLTASGFWSSRMGVADLQYLGNRFVAEWNGCPAAALEHLGVKYQED